LSIILGRSFSVLVPPEQLEVEARLSNALTVPVEASKVVPFYNPSTATLLK